MEIEFRNWLVDRFRKEEQAMLAEMQTQLVQRHKILEQELVAFLQHTLGRSTVSAGPQELQQPVDLDSIVADWDHDAFAPSLAKAGAGLAEQTKSIGDKPSLLIADPEHSQREVMHPSTGSNGIGSSANEVPLDIRTVFDCVRDCDVGAVSHFLDMRGDPNSIAQEYTMRKRVYAPCSMLAVAIIQNNVDMVKTLIDCNAHPNAEYGFVAGVYGVQFSGPCATAAILRNNLEVVRLLVESSADLEAQGSTGARMIWECAYHGRADIASYLLKLKASIEFSAYHPDFDKVSYTPLHVSILRGHVTLASQLLAARASTCRQNEIGLTPLDDAILGCQPNMVSLLVGEGASLYSSVDRSSASSTRSSSMQVTKSFRKSQQICEHPIDRAVDMENSVIIAAIAEGLARQEEHVRCLSIRDVVMFLKHTGDAPANILNAIFRKRSISYWLRIDDESSSKRVTLRKKLLQKRITTAFIAKPDLLFECINVSVMNMSYESIASKLQGKIPLEHDELQQITKLAPHERSESLFSKDMLISHVDLYECLISNVQRDLGVIAAIVELGDQALVLKPCQAILQQCWGTVHRQSMFDVLVHAALLLDFIIIGILLQKDRVSQHSNSSEDDRKLRVVAAVGLVFSVTHFVAELLQCVAFYIQGWLCKYLSDFGNYIDWGRLAGDNIILIVVFARGSEVASIEARNTRIALSGLAFYKWIKLMYALTPFRRFGQSILPILEALRGSGPFMIVLSLCSFGLWHAYISLQPEGMDYFQSWIMIYRLALFGEWGKPDDSSMEESYSVQTFYMIAALMVTITLMNVYIAALSNSFNQATERTVPLFQRNRAKAILSSMAVREGIRHMSPSRRYANAEPGDEILWFCCAAQDASN